MRWLATLALTIALAPPALAHSTEPSRSEVRVNADRVEWTVIARAADLAHALATERDPILLAADPRLAVYARERIAVEGADGRAARLVSARALPEGRTLVRITLAWERPDGGLVLRTRFLADADGEHKDVARVVDDAGNERGFVFGPAGDALALSEAEPLACAARATGLALVAAGLALVLARARR